MLEDDDAGAEGLHVRESESLLIDPVSEQAAALPEDNRVHRESVKIDQVGLSQRLEQLGAITEQEVLTKRLLEPAFLFGDVCP